MTWNYRVVKRTIEDSKGNEGNTFGIHEVYYDDNGKKTAMSTDPMEPYGETFEELKQDLEWMKKALEDPMLTDDDIPEEGAIPLGGNIDKKDLVPFDEVIKRLGLEKDV